MFSSKKKLIRARCSFAPLPLYTGKPLPVIFTPSSKSIMSNSLANSQCGLAFFASSGIVPPERTSWLSSAVFPLGTELCGRLGIFISVEFSSASTSAMFWLNVFESSLRLATFSFAALASSVFPCLKSKPISFDRAFCSASNASSLPCIVFLWLSSSITLSISTLASKFFTSRREITSILFS